MYDAHPGNLVFSDSSLASNSQFRDYSSKWPQTTKAGNFPFRDAWTRLEVRQDSCPSSSATGNLGGSIAASYDPLRWERGNQGNQAAMHARI
jgi:hypothetical protein